MCNRLRIGDEQILLSNELNGSGTCGNESEVLKDIRVRVGTLLKSESVSILLGAGASLECGGPLIGRVPLPIEKGLISVGISGTRVQRVRRWLTVFYLAVQWCGAISGVSQIRSFILRRSSEIEQGRATELEVNLEQVLATLYRWRWALPKADGLLRRLRIDGSPQVDVDATVLDESLSQVTRALARACHLPTAGKELGLSTYGTLLRKFLTRPLNLKRTNIFTLNYDTLVEQASDAIGVVLLDGFVGSQHRVFRPESYEQDLYFPAETTEGRVHRFDRVLHLYKLHGSITWTASAPVMDNPYGVTSTPFTPDGAEEFVIYPTPAKYGETLGMPYSELFRRFASAVVRPQSVLFVIGYGFGDDHVNTVIRQALAVPSFTLVIVDPTPKSDFATELLKQKDRRIWMASGESFGTMSGFVDGALPDLRDEQIRAKIISTYNSITKAGGKLDGGESSDC